MPGGGYNFTSEISKKLKCKGFGKMAKKIFNSKIIVFIFGLMLLFIISSCSNKTNNKTDQVFEYGYNVNGGLYLVGFNSDSTKSEIITVPAKCDGSEVTIIGAGAFSNQSLTSVTLSDGLKMIGSEAFSNCSSLTTITIPNTVTRLGRSVFKGCKSLTSITLSDKLEYIFDNTFDGCTALTSITIPNTVQSLDKEAFNGCTALTTITIPSSVTSLGEGVFNGCTALTTLKFEGTVAQFNEITKAAEWNSGLALDKVTCSNGDVTLEQSN